MSGGRVILVGGGPGAPDLLTVRAARALAAADVVVWGRPFAPEALVREHARPQAELVAWPPATQTDIHAVYDRVIAEELVVARLYSGDPTLYSRLGEEIATLEARGIGWEVVPGVAAHAAAAAQLGRELTEGADWRPLVIATPATIDRVTPGTGLAVYMAGHDAEALEAGLLARGFADTTGCVVAHRVGWPDALLLACRLEELAATMHRHGLGGLVTVLVASDGH